LILQIINSLVAYDVNYCEQKRSVKKDGFIIIIISTDPETSQTEKQGNSKIKEKNIYFIKI